MSAGSDLGRAWQAFTGMASAYLLLSALVNAKEVAMQRKAERAEAQENPRRRPRRRRNAFSYDDLV